VDAVAAVALKRRVQAGRPASGSSEGACSLSLDRRGLEPLLIEADALAEERLAVDALGQTLDVTRGHSSVCEVFPPGVHDIDDDGDFSRGLCGQQAECIALRHRVVERRVPAMSTADELLEPLPRIRRQHVVRGRQPQATVA